MINSSMAPGRRTHLLPRGIECGRASAALADQQAKCGSISQLPLSTANAAGTLPTPAILV
jgi:hypothetical protein